MSEWREMTLGDLGRIVTGKTPSTSVREYFGGDVPFVTPSDMYGRKVISRTERCLTKAGVAAVKSSFIPRGSVMVSCIGSDMGKVTIAAHDCVSNQPINSIVVSEEFSADFIYYNLSTRKGELQSLACSGSAQPILNKGHFSELQILLPPLSEQRAIAAVLGALDDKIELNRRMNETLEAMARALFQNWFVDPTQAGLPKGWREGTLGDLVELRVDRVEPTPEKDGLRYIALEDMPSKSIDLSNYQPGSAVNSSITAFRKGDVLFGSMRPYFHKVGLAFFDGITRTTTFVLRPKHECLRHFSLFHFFSNEVVEFATTASVGTTIPYVRWDALQGYEIALPPDSRLEAFEKTVAPVVQRIAANGEESRTLGAVRDALLPRLLSGELRVPAAMNDLRV